jgi:hypothetical protein
MSYIQGVNFRGTGSVTDGPNDYAEINTGGINQALVDYPVTTPQGHTVGWEVLPIDGQAEVRSRNLGNDPRLVGFHTPDNAGGIFRFDLPSAGTYNVGLGSGDASYATTVGTITLKDTSTTLTTLCSGTTSAPQRFKDATNTEYTNVTWPTNQSLVQVVFTTTICRFSLDTFPAQISSAYVEGPVDILATDNFTRADANPIGGNWTTVTGESDLQIVLDKVEPSTSAIAYNAAYWNAIIWPADQWSEITIDTVADNNTFCFAAVRMSGSDQTYYSAWAQGPLTSGHLYLVKFVSGVQTTVWTSNTVVFNSSDVVGLSVIGSTLTVYLNRVMQFQATDSLISSGKAGMGFYIAFGAVLSNSLVSKWSAGGFFSAAPVSYCLSEDGMMFGSVSCGNAVISKF